MGLRSRTYLRHLSEIAERMIPSFCIRTGISGYRHSNSPLVDLSACVCSNRYKKPPRVFKVALDTSWCKRNPQPLAMGRSRCWDAMSVTGSQKTGRNFGAYKDSGLSS